MKQLSVFGLVVALSISPTTVGQPTTAESKGPPLWLVRNGDADVYLFGRMAVGKGAQWLSPTIEAAFDAADVLWLENPRADGDQGNELIGRLGVAEGYSVLRAIDQSDRDRVLSLLERAGMPARRAGGSESVAGKPVSVATD